MGRKKILVWGGVDQPVRDVIEKLVALKGITISEYIRSLILADLEKRTVFTDALKNELEEAKAQ